MKRTQFKRLDTDNAALRIADRTNRLKAYDRLYAPLSINNDHVGHAPQLPDNKHSTELTEHIPIDK